MGRHKRLVGLLPSSRSWRYALTCSKHSVHQLVVPKVWRKSWLLQHNLNRKEALKVNLSKLPQTEEKVWFRLLVNDRVLFSFCLAGFSHRRSGSSDGLVERMRSHADRKVRIPTTTQNVDRADVTHTWHHCLVPETLKVGGWHNTYLCSEVFKAPRYLPVTYTPVDVYL